MRKWSKSLDPSGLSSAAKSRYVAPETSRVRLVPQHRDVDEAIRWATRCNHEFGGSGMFVWSCCLCGVWSPKNLCREAGLWLCPSGLHNNGTMMLYSIGLSILHLSFFSFLYSNWHYIHFRNHSQYVAEVTRFCWRSRYGCGQGSICGIPTAFRHVRRELIAVRGWTLLGLNLDVRSM